MIGVPLYFHRPSINSRKIRTDIRDARLRGPRPIPRSAHIPNGYCEFTALLWQGLPWPFSAVLAKWSDAVAGTEGSTMNPSRSSFAAAETSSTDDPRALHRLCGRVRTLSDALTDRYADCRQNAPLPVGCGVNSTSFSFMIPVYKITTSGTDSESNRPLARGGRPIMTNCQEP